MRPKRATVALRNAANKFEEETPSISDTGEGCKNESSLQVESLSVGAHKKVQFLTEINNATAQPQGNFVILLPFACLLVYFAFGINRPRCKFHTSATF